MGTITPVSFQGRKKKKAHQWQPGGPSTSQIQLGLSPPGHQGDLPMGCMGLCLLLFVAPVILWVLDPRHSFFK